MIRFLRWLHVFHTWTYELLNAPSDTEDDLRWCKMCGKAQKRKIGTQLVPEHRELMSVYWWETLKKDKFNKNILPNE